MNNRQEYFDVATKIGNVVDKTIDNFLDNDEFGKYKRIIYEPLLEKKRGKQKSRATMAWLSYCTLTNTDPHSEVSEDIAKLITVPELEIWSEYMVNWNFDEKGDVKRNPDIRKKAAVASKSFFEDAIKMSLEVGSDYVFKILETSGNVTNAYTKELKVDVEKGELPMVDTEDFLKWRVEDYGRPGVGKTYTLGHDIVSQYAKNQERKKPLSKIKTIIGEIIGSDYKKKFKKKNLKNYMKVY